MRELRVDVARSSDTYESDLMENGVLMLFGNVLEADVVEDLLEWLLVVVRVPEEDGFENLLFVVNDEFVIGNQLNEERTGEVLDHVAFDQFTKMGQ